MPSQAEGWRYAEGAFEEETPLALIGIEAAIILGIPLVWGLGWKPYKWAKEHRVETVQVPEDHSRL